MISTRKSDRIAATVLSLFLSLSAFSFKIASAQGADATPAPATPITTVTSGDAVAEVTGTDGVLRFDVAENATQFVFDPDFVYDDSFPKHGSAFVTRGYIYPTGTLTGTNGVNPDGSPEFPDMILGEWICRGWFIGEGAHGTTGVIVVTTQLYNFGGDPGRALLISDGYEIADVGVAVSRAITGGTGSFAAAQGVATQTLLSLNATQGANLHFEIEPRS